MEICSIASGSSGNCVYVSTGNTKLLVDAGISGKRVIEGLESINVNPADINGILITHEHSDHIQGVSVLAKKFGLDIYGTQKTLKFIYDAAKGKLGTGKMNVVKADEEFYIGDAKIHPFATSHDALDPVCYRIEGDGRKVALATDLGYYDSYIIDNLSDLDGIYLESNHDKNILMVGHYPYNLKIRIAGEKGHLSNDDAAELLKTIAQDKLKFAILAHLSKENNYAELAYETVRAKLSECCLPQDFELSVAYRDIPSNVYKV